MQAKRKLFSQIIEAYVKEKVLPKGEVVEETQVENRVTHPSQLDHGIFLYRPEMHREPITSQQDKSRVNAEHYSMIYSGALAYKGNQPARLVTDVGYSHKPPTLKQASSNQRDDNPLFASAKTHNSHKTPVPQVRSSSRSKLDDLIRSLEKEDVQHPGLPPAIKYNQPPKGFPDQLNFPEKVKSINRRFTSRPV